MLIIRSRIVMTLSMGILSALTTGFWGAVSDRLGRTKVMSIAVLGLVSKYVYLLSVLRACAILTVWRLYLQRCNPYLNRYLSTQGTVRIQVHHSRTLVGWAPGRIFYHHCYQPCLSLRRHTRRKSCQRVWSSGRYYDVRIFNGSHLGKCSHPHDGKHVSLGGPACGPRRSLTRSRFE